MACGFIYKIENRDNGKVYIGATKRPNKRWYQHQHDGQMPVDKAIKDEGVENFSFNVIRLCPAKEMYKWETAYILKFQSHVSEKGYNSLRRY